MHVIIISFKFTFSKSIPCVNILNFIDFKARIVRNVRKEVQFSSLHAEKWMIICNSNSKT